MAPDRLAHGAAVARAILQRQSQLPRRFADRRAVGEREARGCTKANPAKAAADWRTDPGTTLSIRIFFPLARKEPFLEAVSSVKLSATVLFYHRVLGVQNSCQNNPVSGNMCK